MVDSDPTRRQISIGLGTALGVSLAGCMSGDDEGNGNGDEGNGNEGNGNGDEGNGNEGNGDEGNGDENESGEEAPDPEGSALLGLRTENGDGEEVTIGYDLTLEHADYDVDSFERSYVGDLDELVNYYDNLGEERAEEEEWANDRLPAEPFQIYYTGEWNLTIEANEANDFETVEETIEITEEELTETGSEELMREETIVLEGAMSDEERERQNAEVIEGQFRFDSNHVRDTDYGWGVPDAAEEPGTSVDQLPWEDGDYQRWDVVPVDEEGKWHRIEAAYTDENLVWGLIIDSEKSNWGDYHAAADVVIEEWNESDEQLWRITQLPEDHPNVEEGDELYKIENKENDAVASINTEADADGADITTWWYNGEAHYQTFMHEQ